MPAQLRIYDIRPGLLDDWVARFHAEIVPPRRAYGFEVLGPWINREDSQFVWIVSYEGELGWEEAVDRYYKSPERQAISFDPMDYITNMDTRMLEFASS